MARHGPVMVRHFFRACQRRFGSKSKQKQSFFFIHGSPSNLFPLPFDMLCQNIIYFGLPFLTMGFEIHDNVR